MDDVTFNYIWEQGVKVAVNNVISEIPESIRQKYHVKADFSEENKRILKINYNKLRLQVRNNYFNTGINDENKIDGHKICACFIGACQGVALIDFYPIEEDLSIELIYARNAVAFLTGINVLYLFMLSDFKENNKRECYNELFRRSALEFPETNKGHDSYVVGKIKALALNELFGNDFDILAYADMLFWVELYNKKIIEKYVEQTGNKK